MDVTEKRISTLERQIEKIKVDISGLNDLRRGSLSKQHDICEHSAKRRLLNAHKLCNDFDFDPDSDFDFLFHKRGDLLSANCKMT